MEKIIKAEKLNEILSRNTVTRIKIIYLCNNLIHTENNETHIEYAGSRLIFKMKDGKMSVDTQEIKSIIVYTYILEIKLIEIFLKDKIIDIEMKAY